MRKRFFYISVNEKEDHLVSMWDTAEARQEGAFGEKFVDLPLTAGQFDMLYPPDPDLSMGIVLTRDGSQIAVWAVLPDNVNENPIGEGEAFILGSFPSKEIAARFIAGITGIRTVVSDQT